MMRPSTRRGALVLAILAALSWLLVRQQPEVAVDQVARPDMKLNYALYEFSGRLLDDEGNVNLQIRSPELRNDALSGVGTVDAPEIRVRQDGEQWLITAESAVISRDREVVTLAGDVLLSRQGEAPEQMLEVRSSDVVLNVTPRSARTDAPVSIRDPSGRLDAVGMRLDMTNETYELLNDVRGRYELP